MAFQQKNQTDILFYNQQLMTSVQITPAQRIILAPAFNVNHTQQHP